MEALGHFHYHFWKLERLSYLKCFHRFFTESSQCDLKSEILKHDARFSFCIFWTFYKKKKKTEPQSSSPAVTPWLTAMLLMFASLSVSQKFLFYQLFSLAEKTFMQMLHQQPRIQVPVGFLKNLRKKWDSEQNSWRHECVHKKTF